MQCTVPLPPETGDEAADLAAFAEWGLARERFYHPGRFAPDGSRVLEFPDPEQAMRGSRWGRVTGPNFYTAPGRRLCYYLGAPEPSWLNFSPVPLFVSASRLARYRSRGEKWPVAPGCSYAMDSGAYIALAGSNEDVPWFLDADVYGGMITRFVEDNGTPPDFVAPQDWPCEPSVRAKTGMTTRQHQELTLASYLHLAENFPFINWARVITGWEPEEYEEHAEMYAAAGVDLADGGVVGIGSICRRGHVPSIVKVIERFAGRGYRMHGFGIKTTALPIIGHLLASADSMAWSDTARKDNIRLPECEHTSRAGELNDCRNCFRWALTWRERVLARIRPQPEASNQEEGRMSADSAVSAQPQWRLDLYGPPLAEHDPRCSLDPLHHAKTPCSWPAGTVVSAPVDQPDTEEVATVTAATQEKKPTEEMIVPPPGSTFYCPRRGCGRKATVTKAGKIGSHYWSGRDRCKMSGQPVPEMIASLVNVPVDQLVLDELAEFFTDLMNDDQAAAEPAAAPEPASDATGEALVEEATAGLLAAGKGTDITWAAGVVMLRNANSLSGVMREGWDERFLHGKYVGLWPERGPARHLFVNLGSGAVELHTDPYGKGEPVAQTSLNEIGRLIGSLDPALVIRVHAAVDDWQGAKDQYRVAVGKSVAAKTATPDADVRRYRERTEAALGEGERALVAAWRSRRVVKGTAVDKHVRGTVRMPYQAQGMGPAGTVVPAWVCCSCGGVEVTEFALGNNHGCCDHARPMCSLITPRNHLNAHWTPPADEPKPMAAAPTKKALAVHPSMADVLCCNGQCYGPCDTCSPAEAVLTSPEVHAAGVPRVTRNPRWGSCGWGWTCTAPGCRARAWGNTTGSATAAAARELWLAHAAEHEGFVPSWPDDLVPAEARVEALVAKKGYVPTAAVARIDVSPEPARNDWWVDSAKAWRRAGLLTRQGDTLVLEIPSGCTEAYRVRDMLAEQGGVPADTMKVYEVPTGGYEPLTSTALNDDDTLVWLLAKVGEPLNGRNGRRLSQELADRYAAGLPLVRHNRKLNEQWTFVCPVPSCQGMYDGHMTMREIRAAWFEHALSPDHNGFTPAWDDAAFPVEPEVEPKPQPERKLPKAPRRPRHQVPVIMEIFDPPLVDLSWGRRLHEWEADGVLVRSLHATSPLERSAPTTEHPYGRRSVRVMLPFNVEQSTAYAKLLCGAYGLPESQYTLYRAAAAPERDIEFPKPGAEPAAKAAPRKRAAVKKAPVRKPAEPKVTPRPVVEQEALFDLSLLDVDAYADLASEPVAEDEPEFDLGLLDVDALDTEVAEAPAVVGDRALRAEAREILRTFTAKTPRALLAWAAGVSECLHPLHLVWHWGNGAQNIYGGSMSGGTLGGGRYSEANRKALEVLEGTERKVIVRVPWQEVGQLVGKDRVPADLVERAEAAMTARLGATIQYNPSDKRPYNHPERVAEKERWDAAERECYAVGAAVWAAVRPEVG